MKSYTELAERVHLHLLTAKISEKVRSNTELLCYGSFLFVRPKAEHLHFPHFPNSCSGKIHAFVRPKAEPELFLLFVTNLSGKIHASVRPKPEPKTTIPLRRLEAEGRKALLQKRASEGAVRRATRSCINNQDVAYIISC